MREGSHQSQAMAWPGDGEGQREETEPHTIEETDSRAIEEEVWDIEEIHERNRGAHKREMHRDVEKHTK